jgi:hypothetical protein
MDSTLRAIETHFQVLLPALYVQLYQDGMLDWFLDGGLPNPNWYRDIYPRLRQHPPVLLYALDFELIAPEQVLEQDLICEPSPDHLFIPFGTTGAGDLYCFYPTLAEDGEYPVTLTWHDEDKTEVLAPSLDAFIFREMLTKVTAIDEYSLEGYSDFEALRQDLLRAADSIRPYLKPAWNDILDTFYRLPLRTETVVLPRAQYTVQCLLTTTELQEILVKEMPFTYAGHTFSCHPAPL